MHDATDTDWTELEAVHAAVRARVTVDSRALDVDRVRITRRDNGWHVTAVGYDGATVYTGTAQWRAGRRVVFTIHPATPAAPVAVRHSTTRPVTPRTPTGPARRRDPSRPDAARMAALDYDGLAAYAVQLLDEGMTAEAVAVYDEIERRDLADRAASDDAA